MILVKESDDSDWLLQKLHLVDDMSPLVHLQLPLVSRAALPIHIELLILVREVVQQVRHYELVLSVVLEVTERCQLRDRMYTCDVIGPGVDPGGLFGTPDLIFLVLDLVEDITDFTHVLLLPDHI